MANTYKNIVITPNIGNNSVDPKIHFAGGNTTANTDISLFVYPTTNGTLSFEGTAGQLFSITNDLSNLIFSVADVSGIPSLEVYANALVSVAPFGGNVVIGSTAELVLSSGAGLYANGGLGTAGHVLHSNGTSVYWAADDNSGGTVTSVATGNGLTGGTFTTTGTVSVLANTGIVANTTGLFASVVPENAQTVTAYTLALTDPGKMLTLSNASAITLTVPNNTSAAIDVGTRVDVIQYGAGQVTVAAGTGVTLRSSGSKLKITGQYSGATLWKKATNEWVLIGDISA